MTVNSLGQKHAGTEFDSIYFIRNFVLWTDDVVGVKLLLVLLRRSDRDPLLEERV